MKSNPMLGFAMNEEPKAARELNRVPSGYRGLGKCLNESRKAYLFEYYGNEVWIPKKALVKAEAWFWAPAWAIESSKKYTSDRLT